MVPKHVLVVDDDPDTLEVWAELLRREGYRVSGTSTAREGLAIHRRDRADVIIADVLMPDMDGLELIGKIREESPGTPVIAVSGGGGYIKGALCRKLAAQVGAAAALPKPVDSKTLLETVRTTLASPHDQGPSFS